MIPKRKSDDNEKKIGDYLHKFDVYLSVVVVIFTLYNVFSLFAWIMTPKRISKRKVYHARKKGRKMSTPHLWELQGNVTKCRISFGSVLG